MTEETQSSDDVKIIPADHSLSKKLGGVSLTKVLTPQAVQQAEKVIADSADDFYGDCVGDAAKLAALVAQMKKDGNCAATLKEIIAVSFSAKTKAGLSGYDLVVSLASSLQVYCEKLADSEPGTKAAQIIEWHVHSINHLLAKKIKGTGGETGKAIFTEVEKIGNR